MTESITESMTRSITTVAPATVHRLHADTVFVTGVRPVGADGYVATAVLPEGHPYYAAHTAAAHRRLDPMLVLEAARQAVIHHAHAYYEVPVGTQFLLLKADLRVAADAHRALPAHGPGELTMTLETSSPQWVNGQLRSFAPEFAFAVDGVGIGRLDFAATLATAEHYATLRQRRRGTPPPLSDTLPDPDRSGAAAPGAVGRVHAGDVLLADLTTGSSEAGADETRARVIVPVRHLGLFDHRQDHVPGTLLVEAARQLGIALSAVPNHTLVTGLEACFHTFAELDAPVYLHAARSESGALTVTAVQGKVRAATISVTTHPGGR